MSSLNQVKIIGVLTEDPQIKQTQTGQSVGTLNLITKYKFKDRDGNLKEGSNYHNVEVWRGLADICGQYLKKDRTIYIDGRLQTDSWEDEAGTKKYRTKVTANNMVMLDSLKGDIKSIPSESSLSGYINEAEIIGNMTKDPELRQTPNGATVCNFSVATNFTWRDKEGQNQERVEFHNVVIWGDLAQEASKYLQKGRKVYVKGRVQTRSWETNEGAKKYTTEIIADQLLGLGSPANNSSSAASAEPQAEPVPVAATTQQATNSGEITKDMIPEINYEKNIKPEDLPF